MLFDTLSPTGPRLSKRFTKGIVKWGIGDARQIQQWNPRMRFIAQTSALTGYDKIPSTARRLIYRLTYATPIGNYDVVNRFAF